ncbi:hypothetical protein ACFL0V_01400 [Nanoarchaeota archaeon]
MRTIRPVKGQVLSTEEAMEEVVGAKARGSVATIRYVEGRTYDEAYGQLLVNPGRNPLHDGMVRPLTFHETIMELRQYSAEELFQQTGYESQGFNTCSTVLWHDDRIFVRQTNPALSEKVRESGMVEGYWKPVSMSVGEIADDPVFQKLSDRGTLEQYFTEELSIEWEDFGNVMVFGGERGMIEVQNADAYTRFLVR